MGKSSGPKTMSTMTNQQKVINTEIMNFLQGKVGQVATPYQGQQVANLSQQYLQALGQAPGQNQSLIQGMLSGKTGLDPASTSKYFDKYVASPAMASFDKYIKPRMESQFARSGLFSSRQGDAYNSSLSDLNNQLLGQLGSFQLGNQQANAQLSQQMKLAGLQASQVGAGIVQQNTQQQADSQYQEFLRTSPEASPWLNAGLSYIGQQQLAAYNPQRRGGIGAALGGALGTSTLGNAIGGSVGGAIGGPIGIGIGALAGLLGAF